LVRINDIIFNIIFPKAMDRVALWIQVAGRRWQRLGVFHRGDDGYRNLWTSGGTSYPPKNLLALSPTDPEFAIRLNHL